MNRRTLPQRRHCVTMDVRFGDRIYAVTLGHYEDHATVGEVFISGAKVGSATDAIARDGAILLSFCVQYGLPIAAIRQALTREPNGAPSSIVGAIADRLEVG